MFPLNASTLVEFQSATVLIHLAASASHLSLVLVTQLQHLAGFIYHGRVTIWSMALHVMGWNLIMH